MKHILAIAAALAAVAVSATDMDHKGRVIATVGTANAGIAEITCNSPGGWKFDVSASQDSGRDVVTVRITSGTDAKPPQFGVFFRAHSEGQTLVIRSM